MGKLIELVDRLPHISGEAVCLSCKHSHVAVAPRGVEWMECPNCGTKKATWRFHCERQGALHRQCPCGNMQFYITPDKIYCPNCGQAQTF